jgi:hypothetical protein
MNVPDTPAGRALEKLEYWTDYGWAWVQWYGRVLDYCLLTRDGWSRIREWPWPVWLTVLAAVWLIVFVGSRIVNPSPRNRGRFIKPQGQSAFFAQRRAECAGPLAKGADFVMAI